MTFIYRWEKVFVSGTVWTFVCPTIRRLELQCGLLSFLTDSRGQETNQSHRQIDSIACFMIYLSACVV